MNITDADGLWRLTDGRIENRKNGEVRRVSDMPPGNVIAYMDYNVFIRKCGVAFESGKWPMTHWKSGKISY